MNEVVDLCIESPFLLHFLKIPFIFNSFTTALLTAFSNCLNVSDSSFLLIIALRGHRLCYRLG